MIGSEGLDPRLRAALERARTAGFLGPGDVELHVRHARGFARVVERALDRVPDDFCDLGTGGGPPGLLLAAQWPSARAVFVESNGRRAAHLEQAATELGWSHRLRVVCDRAETVAQSPECREQFTAVTARGFAAPAVTAEIAAGLVAIGGVLVTSDPPEPNQRRWPEAEVAALGFEAPQYEILDAHYVVLRKARHAPDDVPRAVGRPGKRPRW